jgi:hypothetical protein
MTVDFDLLTKGRSQVTSQYIEAYQKSYTSLLYAIAGRSICRTSRGYLGLVHETAEIGDHIYAFLGCRVFYTLRTRSGARREFGFGGSAICIV